MADRVDEESLRDTKPDIEKLATDILIDSAARSRPANCYLDRRLALIDNFVGGVGLSTVDRYITNEIERVFEAHSDMDESEREDIRNWCRMNLMGFGGVTL